MQSSVYIGMVHIFTGITSFILYLLQPVLLFFFIRFLITIRRIGDQADKEKKITAFSTLLWVVGICPLVNLVTYLLLRNNGYRVFPVGQNPPLTGFWPVDPTFLLVFFPIFFPWVISALYCLAGIILKLFYTGKSKPVPINWKTGGFIIYGGMSAIELASWFILLLYYYFAY